MRNFSDRQHRTSRPATHKITQAQNVAEVRYHAGPRGPEDFYRRLGFHPTGEYNEGETVAERLLSASR